MNMRKSRENQKNGNVYFIKLKKQNQQLKEENLRLKKEVELEGRVREHWKTMAELFHDTLWETLIKYEPETYGKWYTGKTQKSQMHSKTKITNGAAEKVV